MTESAVVQFTARDPLYTCFTPASHLLYTHIRDPSRSALGRIMVVTSEMPGRAARPQIGQLLLEVYTSFTPALHLLYTCFTPALHQVGELLLEVFADGTEVGGDDLISDD
jgi:hypothetical protein